LIVTERVVGVVLPALETESQVADVFTANVWPAGSLVTDRIWTSAGLDPTWTKDKELGLIDIVGSIVTVRVTWPAIGQKLAAHFTATVPTYVPAVKLPAVTAIARSTSAGVTGIVPKVGLTDNQLPPEFVDAEAVKPTALPLETESSHLLDEQDRFALFRSYAHVMGASVVATWPPLG
jgi:hypothetical protein